MAAAVVVALLPLLPLLPLLQVAAVLLLLVSPLIATMLSMPLLTALLLLSKVVTIWLLRLLLRLLLQQLLLEVLMVVVRRTSCLRQSPSRNARPTPRPSNSHSPCRWLRLLQYQLYCPHRYHRRSRCRPRRHHPNMRREGTALMQSDQLWYRG
jgi:hypothetical protein